MTERYTLHRWDAVAERFEDAFETVEGRLSKAGTQAAEWIAEQAEDDRVPIAVVRVHPKPCVGFMIVEPDGVPDVQDYDGAVQAGCLRQRMAGECLRALVKRACPESSSDE